jgi:ubiquinone/menaquinone biosynthesis C-methylase UbiE
MGLYTRYLFPRLMEHALGTGQVHKLRHATLALVSGEVLEIGFGTGLNLAHYPATVTRLTTIEPVAMLPRVVGQRIAAAPFPVRQLQLDAAGKLPLEDATFDFVVSTFTLCSIPDVIAALGEIRRTLKPDGQFIFLEHGRSDAPKVARWQDRLNPIQKVIGCGCHLNRQIDRLIAEGGLKVTELERFLMKDTPRIAGEMYKGTAVVS